MAKRPIPNKQHRRNLLTRRNTENGTYKQLDYMMVRNKQRNWDAKTRTKGTGNITSTNQHQLLITKIRILIKTENDLFRGHRHIQYDIDTLRGNKHILTGEITNEPTHQMLASNATIQELATARHNHNEQQIKQWGL